MFPATGQRGRSPEHAVAQPSLKKATAGKLRAIPANLFRATQAEEKLRREKITGKDKANTAHRDVGAKVRQTIKELGGTMPEELPFAESVKKLEAKAKKSLKKPKS